MGESSDNLIALNLLDSSNREVFVENDILNPPELTPDEAQAALDKVVALHNNAYQTNFNFIFGIIAFVISVLVTLYYFRYTVFDCKRAFKSSWYDYESGTDGDAKEKEEQAKFKMCYDRTYVSINCFSLGAIMISLWIV